MDRRTRGECDMDIHRINTILGTNVLVQPQHPLFTSAYTELVICLRDLLWKAEKFAHRIAFTDDIVVNGYVKDITDAVTAHRDACCHINSFKHRFEGTSSFGAFNCVFGKGSNRVAGVSMPTDYDDDIAFFFGSNRLYFGRHILRAFEEGKNALEEPMSKAV